ncbi:MAG: YeeE/YedE family protein [Candidatus Bathyarchaeota archaeon]|nr:YeeE/YedE thiosulfate transporter family protein [Candidatus Bathyarchaeum tardum]WGM90131.1 MAG: YeeE/YedE thiosulfate transporter family protein [Candidatus Bathyarchaeum tardum]WNZ29735.1 MAG: YeeE/YedE family protein [Candidatus Bathyarchaeota archaeon]
MNKRNIIVLIGGILFGFGLSYSGMTKQEIVLSFLQFKDFGLIFVLGGAALVAAFSINVLAKYQKKPVLGSVFKPRRRILSWKIIIGAIIFGIGWGLSGQCPGSAVASLGTGNYPILLGILAMFIGAYVKGLLDP